MSYCSIANGPAKICKLRALLPMSLEVLHARFVRTLCSYFAVPAKPSMTLPNKGFALLKLGLGYFYRSCYLVISMHADCAIQLLAKI